MSFDPFEFVRGLQGLREQQAPQIQAVDTSPPVVDLGPYTPPVVAAPVGVAPGVLGPYTPKNAPTAAPAASGAKPADWVTVSGQYRLSSPAAQSFLAAQTAAGVPIRLNSAGRSHDEQVQLYAQKPGLAAKPGTSLHEQGLAIDVANVTPAVRAALLANGWHQFDPKKEPWHFSYGRTG